MGNFQPTIDYITVKSSGVNFFETLLKFLDAQMELPTLFGWFHLLCFGIVIALCVLVFFKARNLSDKQFNLIIGITGITMIVLEIYKQLNYSYDHVNDTWSYQWYAFPFQFCATPMYVLTLAAFLKNGKVKDSLCSYLATYGFFAGCAVMFYPGDVFIRTIGINIQTMIHHGGMVVIGVLMYVSGRAKFSHKTILKALPTFCVFVTLAMIMNVLYGLYGDPNQTFNMFFISPYYPCTLPVLSMFYGKVPYVIFLLLYIAGFTIAGYVMNLIAMGIHKLRSFLLARHQPLLAVAGANVSSAKTEESSPFDLEKK